MPPRPSPLVPFLLGVAALVLVATPVSAQVATPLLPPPGQLLTGGGAVTGASPRGATTAGTALVGTFRLTAGQCTGAGVTGGSWFRMVQPGGTASGGPFVVNSDSPCGDQTWTPLAPGTDGGLVTGAYQAHPDPAFDTATGSGRAGRITKPARFFGVDFSSATNATDPQTGVAVPAPSVTADGTTLAGDLRAFAAAWNRQHFNQGSPKPDGSKPGSTAGPTGTYDAASGAFTLEWASQIVGGPFNNFTGVWHLEGTFVASGSSPATTTGTSSTADTGAAVAGRNATAATPSRRSGTTPRTGGASSAAAALALVALGGGSRMLSRRARRGTLPASPA